MDQMGHPFVSARVKTAKTSCESMSGMDTERSESVEAYGRWEGTEFVFNEPLPLRLEEGGHVLLGRLETATMEIADGLTGDDVVLTLITHHLLGKSDGPALTDRGRLDNDEAVD